MTVEYYEEGEVPPIEARSNVLWRCEDELALRRLLKVFGDSPIRL